MSESLRAALPESAYLERIGALAYSVCYLEWTLLGDLDRLSDDLPSEMLLGDLEARTTGSIAKRVQEHAAGMKAGPVKDYVLAVAEALQQVAPLRNDILHARPATTPDGKQRLIRAEVKNRKATGHRFWIDDEWMDETTAVYNSLSEKVNRLRPPLE